MAIYEQLEYRRKGVQGGTDTHQDQDNGESLPGRIQPMWGVESHRSDGGNSLIDGVKEAEPEYQVPRSAQNKYEK